jgi:hypothetical protein
MLFKKLFKLLVVSGALIGTGSACTATAQGSGSSSDDKKAPQADGGTASGGSADAGTGGGAPGW